MRVAMIGTGYVGLLSGACLADFGHDVMFVDKDVSKIEAIQGRKIRSTSCLQDLVSRNSKPDGCPIPRAALTREPLSRCFLTVPVEGEQQ